MIGPAKAQQGEPLAFMTPFGFIPDFLPLMDMVSGGHLARQGFAPRLIGGQGTAPTIQQLVAGQVQFVYVSALDVILAAARQNVPLLTISTLYQASTFQMVSLTERPIRNAADLRGKTVGIVSVGGATDILLNIMLAKNGMQPDAVRREVTGNSPGAVEFIRQGRVDCFMCAMGVANTLRRTNAPVDIWSTDKYAPMPSQVFVTTRDFAQQRPETVVRFLRALRASCEGIIAGPIRGVYERASRDFEIAGIRDLDGAVSLMEVTVRDLWLSEGRDNLLRNVPRLWAAALDGVRSANLAPITDVSPLWTNTFVEQALRG